MSWSRHVTPRYAARSPVPCRNSEWVRCLAVLTLRWRSMPRLSPAARRAASRGRWRRRSGEEAGRAVADRRCEERLSPCRNEGPWCRATPARYPIQAASYMLPGFGESPRLGFQALCAIARWLGSRHEQTSVCECLGDAVATTAAWGRSAVGAAAPAADPEPLERGGDR